MRPLKKWWEKKAHENLEVKQHYKSWCVIRRVTNVRYDTNKWVSNYDYDYEYLAIVRSNAPEYYDNETGKIRKSTHVDNLTQAEAIAMAKMLNFVGEIDE